MTGQVGASGTLTIARDTIGLTIKDTSGINVKDTTGVALKDTTGKVPLVTTAPTIQITKETTGQPTAAELKANTDRLISDVKSNFVTLPVFLERPLIDPKTNKPYPAQKYYVKDFHGCSARYSVAGGSVSFQITTKNLKRVCSSIYTAGSIMFTGDAAWNPESAAQKCGSGKHGVDVKRVCEETSK